jgi:DNA-directed RNA polymerase alpha subunit
MRTFTVLLRSGQVATLQGDNLRYNKAASEGNDHTVVEVWSYDENNQGIITSLFDMSQIQGIFDGEITGSEDIAPQEGNAAPDALSVGIKSLGLPYRIVRSLLKESSRCARIATVGELIGQTAEDLLERPDFGKASLEQVRAALVRSGLKLAGDP